MAFALSENLLHAIGGILIFKSVTYIPAVEDFIRNYPLIFIILGVVLFIYGRHIAKKIGLKVSD